MPVLTGCYRLGPEPIGVVVRVALKPLVCRGRVRRVSRGTIDCGQAVGSGVRDESIPIGMISQTLARAMAFQLGRAAVGFIDCR